VKRPWLILAVLALAGYVAPYVLLRIAERTQQDDLKRPVFVCHSWNGEPSG
jgi:hypothetical protein